jgi:hypothetical protein
VKKTAENRYPHAATLFKFCKEALEIRYEGNVKVIDQDVGAILNYDPADCSHWKKGKKNIRALATLRSIADHLAIDERLLIDIAAGKVTLEEAVFEYRGYGDFALHGRILENLKKEFFRNPTKWQPENTSQKTFEELFDVERAKIVDVANSLVEKGNFTEAPLYMPEIFKLIPEITLVEEASLPQPIETSAQEVNGRPHFIIKYREMRPYTRFLLAKELFTCLVALEFGNFKDFKKSPQEVLQIQSNIFAGLILVPGAMLKKEVESIDSSMDLVAQLAETFWVSKALMNQRLRDYLDQLN